VTEDKYFIYSEILFIVGLGLVYTLRR